MWLALALLSALLSAVASLVLKRAVDAGGVVASTVAFRMVSGLLLAALTLAARPLPELTPAYWRITALVLAPEIGGMVCYSLALRAGELSHVQPLLGLIPLFVTAWGALVLGELPSPLAAAGVLLVAAGVYAVGLRAGASAVEPLRALVRSRAGWYALGASVFWSITTVLHKLGIAQVGPVAWGATLTLGSALLLALVLPLLAQRQGASPAPPRPAAWSRWVLAGGICFAGHQLGLYLALRAAQAGYVSALTASSSLIATLLGVVVLHERGATRARLLAALLVSSGAALIALGS